MRLSAVLAEQGHELVMWGPEWSRSDIEATGAQFVRLEVEMPSEPTFIGHAAKVAGRAEQHAGHLIDQFYGYDVDAVVHDSLALWACVAAEHLGLPRVVSHPMFPIIDPYQLPPDVQRTPPAPSDPAAALAEFETNWKSIARRWGVEIGSPHAVVHSTPRSDATIVYTTELIMDGRFRPPPRWHYVGPLMEPRPPATYPERTPSSTSASARASTAAASSSTR
jgi:UDP:flavonoid glycosyltransferase YjiC (YdhE family)